MVWISKISDFILNIEKILVTVLLSIMFLSLTAGVVFRYFLNNPLHWSEEVAIFTLAWLTFIGGSMTIKRQQTAAVTFLMERLSGRTYYLLNLLSYLTIFVFSLFVFCFSIPWILSPNIAFQKSLAMQMPMIYPYLSVPVGFLFLTIHSLELLLKNFKYSEGGSKEA
ncbi:TRAP transporter small permease [Halalkalibacterium ligniniphilum]|uniref:TRAP transporter small permease n=1 Tax=Halalkalibacterium ligniniphilum TaxID=1134413 RepID=UPI00034C19A8|nr:TRAP transporter small permease [Halalkalibacterium ligniniphilum]